MSGHILHLYYWGQAWLIGIIGTQIYADGFKKVLEISVYKGVAVVTIFFLCLEASTCLISTAVTNNFYSDPNLKSHQSHCKAEIFFDTKTIVKLIISDIMKIINYCG